MASVTVKIKFLTIAKGRPYFRRRGWQTVALRSAVDDTEGLRAEIAELVRTDGQKQLPPPGSLGRLILDYQATAQWSDLAPASHRAYGRALAKLEPCAGTQIAKLDRAGILRMRDQVWHPKHGRWLANMIVKVLGLLLKHALDTGRIRTNPLEARVRSIRAPRDAERANRPWTAAERHTVMERAQKILRLPLAIAMCTGLRRSDIFRLTWADVADGEIRIRTAKRKTYVRLPVHPFLARALDEAPRVAVQICPLNASSFGTMWARFKKELEADGVLDAGLTIHGLRHSLGTMLSEAGLSDDQISRVLGQQSAQMARHYSATAQLPEATRATISKLDFGG